MALPKIGVDTATALLPGGVKVDIRGLTFDEAATMRGEQANAICISLATGTDLAETEAWLAGAPAGLAQGLVEAILKLSLIGEEAQFQE